MDLRWESDNPMQVAPEARAKVDISKALKLRFKGVAWPDIGKIFETTGKVVELRCRRLLSFVKDPDVIRAYEESEQQFLKSLDMELALGIAARINHPKSSVNNLAYAKDKIFTHLRLLQGESTANISNLTQIIQAAHRPGRVVQEVTEAVDKSLNQDTNDVIDEPK